MADAVFYNSMAWVINGSDFYEKNVVNFISTWFLNPDTYMQPNLEYAQMNRGPEGQVGAHTGLLYVICRVFSQSANLFTQGWEMHGQGRYRYTDPARKKEHRLDFRS